MDGSLRDRKRGIDFDLYEADTREGRFCESSFFSKICKIVKREEIE